MRYLALLILVLSAQTAFARKGFIATQFQLGGIRSIPSQWSSSAFVHVAWTPTYRVRGGGYRGEIGFTGLRNSLDERYLSVNYQAFAYALLFSLVAIEGGAGMQSAFHTAGGTHPLLTANIVLSVEGGTIDRLVMGYSRFFVPDNGTDQFYSGVGFKF